jgi:hypothetical protein
MRVGRDREEPGSWLLCGARYFLSVARSKAKAARDYARERGRELDKTETDYVRRAEVAARYYPCVERMGYLQDLARARELEQTDRVATLEEALVTWGKRYPGLAHECEAAERQT